MLSSDDSFKSYMQSMMKSFEGMCLGKGNLT